MTENYWRRFLSAIRMHGNRPRGFQVASRVTIMRAALIPRIGVFV